MSLVLGIFDGTHDAGACLIQNGKVIAACDEERWSRKKGQGGFPVQSVRWLFHSTGLELDSIDRIAIAGLINPNPVLRMLRPLQQQWRLDEGQFCAPNNRFSNWIQFQSPFPKLKPTRNVLWSFSQNRADIFDQNRNETIVSK